MRLYLQQSRQDRFLRNATLIHRIRLVGLFKLKRGLMREFVDWQTPFPIQTYPSAFLTGMLSAVQRLRT